MTSWRDSFRAFEYAGWRDDDMCQHYDEHFGAITIQSVGALLDAAGVAPGRRVLDVCTGAGYAAGLAVDRGAAATGVDFSLTQIEMARARYPKTIFREGDGAALPFPDATLDGVVNSLGMPYFEDPDAALREAFRVLKRGGRFAFTVYDHPQHAVGLGAVYSAVQAHGSVDIGLPAGPNFFLFSNPTEAETRLQAAGFHAVSVTTVPQTWSLASPDELCEAVLSGTVRAAATLQGQRPEAFEAIRAAIRETISTYKRGESYEVPMPVVLVSATKP
jgi:ubiquinone/menaquinone biosynthesis C-methylase UbiE